MTRALEWGLSLAVLCSCAARQQGGPGDGAAASTDAPPSSASVAVDAALPPDASWPGVVVATRSHHVAVGMTAIVATVEVDVGDPVRAGDVLVRLDAQPFEDALAIVDATVASRAAELDGARAALSLAESELTDTRALAHAGHAPAQQLRTASAQRDQAGARLALARATLEAARAEQRRARHALDATTIRARIDGVIAARHVDPGQSVNAGTTLLRVVDPSVVGVRVGLDAARASALPEGAAFVVTDDHRRWRASLRRRAPELDVTTEQLLVELAGPDDAQPPPIVGAAVSVRLGEP